MKWTGLPQNADLCNITGGSLLPEKPSAKSRRHSRSAKGVKSLSGAEVPSFLDFLIQRKYLKGPHVETVRMLQQSRFFFGVLALREEYITIEQLEEVLTHQQSTNFEKKIGEIMRAKGFMSEDQIDGVLAKQDDSAENQAELIVDIGLMDPDKLDEALREYKRLLDK